jgi:hypothetical protein
MVQRSLCCKDRALHAVFCVCVVESGPALALHSWGIQGQYGDAKAVLEPRLDLTTLEHKGSCELEGNQPGAGWAAHTVR